MPSFVASGLIEVVPGLMIWTLIAFAITFFVLRRFAFGRADQLRIVARPPKGRRLGLYATRRAGSPAHPYRTLLRGIEPTEGSCDCADVLRSSLGLCKHLLTVLEDVASRRGGLDEAGREPTLNSSPLRWDPVRPLTDATLYALTMMQQATSLCEDSAQVAVLEIAVHANPNIFARPPW